MIINIVYFVILFMSKSRENIWVLCLDPRKAGHLDWQHNKSYVIGQFFFFCNLNEMILPGERSVKTLKPEQNKSSAYQSVQR